jgi:hypothetical protein
MGPFVIRHYGPDLRTNPPTALPGQTGAHMFTYGSNTPGYLPDSEPWTVHTFAEAKAGLISDLKYAENNAAMNEDEHSAEDFCAAAEDVNLWSSPCTILAGNLAWWIVASPDAETCSTWDHSSPGERACGDCDICLDNSAR